MPVFNDIKIHLVSLFEKVSNQIASYGKNSHSEVILLLIRVTLLFYKLMHCKRGRGYLSNGHVVFKGSYEKKHICLHGGGGLKTPNNLITWFKDAQGQNVIHFNNRF